MNVTQSNHPQGSPEWKAGRHGKFNASEAAAMLGLPGAYESRDDLMHRFVTGIEKEIPPALQFIFDRGHLFEALARPLAEQIIEDEVPLSDLYPVVLAVEDDPEMPLSSSQDGRTMCKTITWEHKTLNKALAAAFDTGVLPEIYPPQMEQGFILSPTTKKCLFMATKWEESDEVEDGKVYGTVLDEDGNERRYVLIEEKHSWYYPNQELQARILHGWKQFAEDAKNYQYVEEKPKAVAGPVETLPSIFVTVEGRITDSNLPAFVQAAHEYIDRINIDLESDEDFATAAKNVNELESGEKRLESVKANALAQTSSIDELFRAIDQIKAEMKKKRLYLADLVKTKKESKKVQIITLARQSIESHIATLNTRIGGNWMPAANGAVFAESIKGMSSLDNMRKTVGNTLHDKMWEADMMADRIEANRKSLTGEAHDWMFLFPDFPAVCQKSEEDFAALRSMRITNHKAAEEKRMEAEREKIRAEERVKAEREAQAKAKAEEDRIRAEEQAKAKSEQIARDAEELKKRAEFEAEQAQGRAALAEANQLIASAKAAPAETPIEQAAETSDSGNLLKLGQIGERLGFIVTAEFIASLGINPAAHERSAKLYRESDFTRLCNALIDKITTARNAQYQPH